jgi:transposase
MGLFPPAPGGGENVNHGYKGKGVVMHLLADGSGNPIAITTTQANASERLQVNILIKKIPISSTKKMIILEADKGYDCSWLRNELLNKNIFPLIPYRQNNHNASSFKEMFSIKSKRWKVERAFAWLKRKCRRLLMRWERISFNWEAFTVLGLIFVWLENLVG